MEVAAAAVGRAGGLLWTTKPHGRGISARAVKRMINRALSLAWKR